MCFDLQIGRQAASGWSYHTWWLIYPCLGQAHKPQCGTPEGLPSGEGEEPDMGDGVAPMGPPRAIQ